MPTSTDAEISFYRTATGQSIGSIADLEFKYYSGLSGLTPVAKYSLADHQKAYWSSLTGITKASLADLEMAYLDSVGIVAGSLSTRRYLYFSGGAVVPRTGTLNVTLPPIGASFSGFVGHVGVVSATLPPVQASFSGTSGGLLPVTVLGVTSGSVNGTVFTMPWSALAPANGSVTIVSVEVLQTSVITTPTGFTLKNDVSDGTSSRTITYSKTCDGTETGNITVTSDGTGQKMSGVAINYGGISDVLPSATPSNPSVVAGGGTTATTHVSPATTPGTSNPVILYIYGERATSGNTTTLTTPAGSTRRIEASSFGTGGTYITIADDGLVTSHASGVAIPADSWTTSVATGRYHCLTFELTRVPFNVPPVATNKPLMGASTSNNTTFNTLNGVAGPLTCRRIFLGNIGSTTTWQNSATSQETGTGRRTYISFKPTNTSTFATDLTAQGNFSNFLDTIPVDQEVVITCYHEPEQEINANQFTLAQWKAAVQKCGEIIHNKNRPLLRNAFILMGGWSFDNSSPYNVYDWITWSDPSKIDVIGIDPYIESSNDPSISTILTVNNSGKGTGSNDSVMTNLLTINKPFFIGEWGVTETNKTLAVKATEITNFYNWMKNTWNPAHPNNKFEAAIYFNNNLDVPSDPDRTWELHDAPLDAFVAACADSRT